MKQVLANGFTNSLHIGPTAAIADTVSHRAAVGMGIPMGIPVGMGMGWVWGLKFNPHGSPGFTLI